MSKLSDEESQRLRLEQQMAREKDRSGWSYLERRLWDRLQEAENIIVQAQDALGVDHPVWWLLDDYDGSGDSTKRMRRFVKESRELLRHAAQETTDPEFRDGIEKLWLWWNSKDGYIPTEK